MMARGKLVPVHLQGSPGDCLMVIEVSMRWGMSPFAVAQCTSVIQGKLMFEGKLVGAALNTSGIMAARLDYEFSGANGQRAVTVRGTLRGETKTRDVTVHLADAKTTNGMWVKQPDQQLVYAGTRVWARRHAPEVMLGVYAPEEFDRDEPFNGPTIEATTEASSAREAINEAVPMRAAAAPMPRPPVVTEDTPLSGRNAEVRDEILQAYATLQTRQEYLRITDEMLKRVEWFKERKPVVYNQIRTAMAQAWERTVPPQTEPEPTEPEDDFPGDLPDLEIAGADKMASG
jgi:hypothetical protein